MSARADETRARVESALEEVVATVDSKEKARAVVRELEERAAGKTEAETSGAASGGPSAATAVEVAAATAAAPAIAPPGVDGGRSPSTARTAEALVETAAQSIAAKPDAPAVVEAARRVAGTSMRGYGQRPPEVVRGHRLLEEAVVEQMGPLDSLDARLFLALNHLPHWRWVDRAVDGVTLATAGGTAWVVLLLVARAFGVPKSGRAVRELLPGLLGTGLIVEGPIKAYFRRRRPFIDIVRATVVGKKPGNWSFPSGHTAAAFATARILSAVWPERSAALYGGAAAIAFSRVYAGAHYPGDVLSGAVVGSILVEGIRRLTHWLLRP